MCYHCQKKATDCVRTSGRSRGLALHHNILPVLDWHWWKDISWNLLFGGKWTRVALCPHHPQSCMPEPELGPSEPELGTQDGLGHGMNDMGFSENLVIPNSNQASFFHWNGLINWAILGDIGRESPQGHHGGTTCGAWWGWAVTFPGRLPCCSHQNSGLLWMFIPPFNPVPNEDHRYSSIRHTEKWWKCIDNDRYGFVWKYGTPKSTG